MVGAGIYVLTGTVAKDIAGPGVIVSFILAGVVSMLAAICYAEFGTRVPKAGSAYVYTYISIGEFWAFIIGWNILLEHMLGAASVARAWSGYVDSLLGGWIENSTLSVVGELHEPQLFARYPDILAFLVCIFYALALAVGVKATALINSILTVVNIAVMVLVICVGFWYADTKNWSQSVGGFLPYGFSGVIAGAATCFYAFVGFDSIATAGEEAKNPAASIPLATMLSLTAVSAGYILVSAALTLMIPTNDINSSASLPEAFGQMGLPWAKYIITVGALCGMTTTLLGSLFALPRCMYAMASDGLLFSCFGKINSVTQVPVLNLAISGISSALLALVFDLRNLVEFMSIGTLLAYTIVSASVIILRYRPLPVLENPIYAPDTPENEDDENDTTSQYSIDTASPTSDLIESMSAGRLQAKYKWLEPLLGRFEPGSAVSAGVLLFTALSFALCFQLKTSWSDSENVASWWALLMYGFLIFIIFSCIFIISVHHQNIRGLNFKVPFVPLLPAFSIFCNIALMVHLSFLTWLRFFIWVSLGMLIYFGYGIHHSKEGAVCSAYSMLMSSNSETKKSPWAVTGDDFDFLIGAGGSSSRTVFQRFIGRKKSDNQPIVEEELIDDETDENDES